MANVSDGIIHRINSLLNKTVENGCTVAEAASAAAVAQRMLTQHRLTVADLSVAGESNEDIHNNAQPLYAGQRRVHWKDKLANTLSIANGCRAYVDLRPVFRGGRNCNEIFFRIIGRDSDIKIVRYFFEYLTREIDNLCKCAMGCGEGAGKSWSNSFKNGATDAVCARIEEANREVRQEASVNNCTALVKLENKDDAVDKWVGDHLKLKKSPVKRVRYTSSAYVSGKLAGGRINLNKGLAGEKTTKRLA